MLDFKRKTKKVKEFTEEQKKWIAEYRRNDRKIFKTNFDVNNMLKFSRTTTIKKDVIKMQKMSDDSKHGTLMYDDKMKEKVKGLKSEVEKFKDHLKNFSNEEDFLLKIENHAEYIKTKITDFKDDHIPKFEEIQDQIDILDSDIQALNSNLHEYEKQPKIEKNNQNLNLKENLNINTPSGNNLEYNEELYEKDINYRAKVRRRDEINNSLESIISRIRANGGVNCGWPSKDHSKFTMVVFKLKGRVDSLPFFDEIQMELPLYSEESVKEHVEIWKLIKSLENEKKILLDDYKEIKSEIKEIEEDYEKMKLRMEQKKSNKRYNSKISKEEREKKKEMIMKWKQEREVKEVLEAEKTEEMKRFEIDKKWRKRQVELEKKKIEILEYKEMREVEREKEKQRKEMNKKERKYISVEQKQRIKEKEKKMLQRKKRLVSANKEKQKTNLDILEDLKHIKNPKYLKVRSRLKQETTAILGKQRGKFDPEKDTKKYGDNMAGMLIRNQGRAMAGWKAGLI